MARTTLPHVRDRVLQVQQGGETLALPVDSPAWYAWLAGATSFAFSSPAGSFTARKERAGSGRGEAYWRAYRRRAGRLHRVYLGQSQAVTAERLEAAAAALGAAPPASASPAPASPAATGSTPVALTRFIGRAPEIAEIERLLGTTRLLTLSGAGGVGKTRLAREVAARVACCYLDGVVWVDLAPLAEPLLVPQAVVMALGIHATPGEPVLATLLAALRSQRRLLILDNAEHLIEAVAHLAEALLQGCAQVSLLVTSREPLAIPGEFTWRVPSLAVPDLDCLPDPGNLAHVPAVALFLDRTQAARPGFAITSGNARAVAEICVRLDGIPLALELAAVRVRALPVEELARRLAGSLQVLTGGIRTAVPRHQTLRAVIDWSYHLLPPAEQALLLRLSVFAGGWTLSAAEAVCSDADAAEQGCRGTEGSASASVLDLLTRLVDKSLVQLDDRDDGAARYRLLETVRQYAAERLSETGETEQVRPRHAQWCLALAEQAEPYLLGPDQLLWLDRLDDEQANLRVALAWLQAQAPPMALRLASRLWRWWEARAWLAEGRRWLEEALAAALEPTTERAQALLGAGVLARLHGDFPAMYPVFEEGLALARGLNDRRLLGWLLREAGYAQLYRYQMTMARERLEEGLALARDLNDPALVAACLCVLAWAARMEGDVREERRLRDEALPFARASGDLRLLAFMLREHATAIIDTSADFARAEALVQEGLAIGRRLQSPGDICGCLKGLGRAALLQGDAAQAVALLEQSQWLAPDQGRISGRFADLLHLGRAYLLASDLTRAEATLEECIRVSTPLGWHWGVLASLKWLGVLAWRRGDLDTAMARLREALRGWREEASPVWEEFDACLEALAVVSLERAATAITARWAARLLGAAEAARRIGGRAAFPMNQPIQEQASQAALAALGEADYAAAWAAGLALTPGEAIDLALADEAPTVTGDRMDGGVPASPLTGREQEVAALVAAGLTNRQIAVALSISKRTVDRHVANILTKLDVTSRTQIAAWAADQRLAAMGGQ